MTYNRRMARFRLDTTDVLLNIAAYVTVVLVGVVGWFAVPDPGARWVVLALLVAFVLLNTYYDRHPSPRHVHAYLGAQTVLVVGLYFLEKEEASLFNVLYFVLSAQAMVCLPPRQAIPWIVVFCLITGVTAVLTYGGVGILYVLPNFGGYAFFGTFGKALRDAQRAHQESQRLLEELRAAQGQLQHLAVAEERNRLSRELHDSLGHRLTVAVVQLEGAQRLIPTEPERAARMTGAMREQLKEALTDLRNTVAALRAPLEDDVPLGPALKRLAQTFQEGTGLTVRLSLPSALPPLPHSRRLALYRAAQESLTNAQRHAAARHVLLELILNDGFVTLTASDDGKGFPSEIDSGGLGLNGLRERAAQLGGSLDLATGPDGGAQLRFSLPLHHDDALTPGETS
jgi:signal transduction histidine kinase